MGSVGLVVRVVNPARRTEKSRLGGGGRLLAFGRPHVASEAIAIASGGFLARVRDGVDIGPKAKEILEEVTYQVGIRTRMSSSDLSSSMLKGVEGAEKRW